MIETMGDRLKQYNHLKITKSCDVVCPVCNKLFVNRYSLSNHFLVRGMLKGLNI